MAFGPHPPPIQAHICVKGGLEAIDFNKNAFGAKCPFHQLAEDGKRVIHANIELFRSEVMLHDEFPEIWAFNAPLAGSAA
jgi:PhnB protein